MESTIGTITSALFVILGSLAPLFAQGPVQQQQPEFVKQGQQLLRDGELPNGLALYRQTLQTSPDSLVAISAPAPSQTASSSAASGQGELPELRVAVLVAPPMVMEQNGSLTGFSIDLWNAIATRLKVKTSYQIMPDVRALEEALRSNAADLSPAMFITSTRDADFDFSYPTFDAGLQIMVRGTGATERTPSRISPVLDMLRLMFSRTSIEWVGVALMLVLIPAHLLWWLDRRQQNGTISNPNYFPGILEACYWGLSALAAQAEVMPRQWLARGLSVFWLFASVVFIASYTAQLTTTLTVEQIRGAIEGPDDLPGKQVATLASSPAVDYLRGQHAQAQEFPTLDQMFKALLDEKVDAVVSPAPVLLYYAAHEGKGRVKVVGPEFDSRPLAILVQLDSPLRRKIDRALVTLREDGTYGQVYEKWFGNTAP
ncbi:MAG: transporter substrate-binding domain-containing protein [Candidatus Sulfotelmatobacter sp.]